MDHLTLHDLLTSRANILDGKTVVSITLRDYGINLDMFPGIQLEIIEYWELLNSKGELIDNALTTEKRKNFLLFKVIGKKVRATEKFFDKFHITFEGELMFVIHFDHKAQVDKREQERKKYFGDLMEGE